MRVCGPQNIPIPFGKEDHRLVKAAQFIFPEFSKIQVSSSASDSVQARALSVGCCLCGVRKRSVTCLSGEADPQPCFRSHSK